MPVWNDSVWIVFYWLFTIVCLGSAIFAGFHYMKQTGSSIKKKQLKIILGTTFIAIIFGNFIDSVLPLMGVYIVPLISNLIVLVWAFGILIAISRYKFMEVTTSSAADDIISTMPDCLFLLDLEGDIVTVNNYTLELLGYRQIWLKGESVKAILGDDDIKGSLLESIAGRKEIKNRDVFFRTKGGDEIPVNFSTSIILDEDGDPAGTLCIAKEMTDYWNRERAIQESEEKYRLLAENVTDGIWILDLETNVFTYASPSVERIIGYKPEEMIGMKMSDLLTPGSYESALELIADEIKKEQLEDVAPDRIIILEAESLHKDDKIQWLEHTGKLLRDESGSITGILGVSRNVTERKKKEEEMMRAKTKAEESERLKSAFLANVSHEIRTPMTAIIGSSDLMLFGEVNEEQVEYLNIIQRSGNSLLKIINNILDLSKIEAGKLSVEHAPFSLEEILGKVKANGKALISQQEKNINLGYSFPEGLSKMIVGDSIRLCQVLDNLVSNSIKFTNEGYIDFGVSLKENGMLEFYVLDTGIGIPSKEQDNIFERFRQAETNLERGYSGTGLGLAISRGLVDLMGGEIWLESNSKEEFGTSFYFTIPYKPAL